MSPVDYHAWTHLPKELGGTDPLELLFSVPEAAFCHGSKGSFSQASAPIGWTDVDTTDSTVFSVDTNTVTNDRINIAEDGILISLIYAGATTPANDWGVGSTMSSAEPASGGGFGFNVGSYNGLALGAKSAELRVARVFGGASTVIYSTTHAGSMSYAFAAFHLVHLPVADVAWTDIA